MIMKRLLFFLLPFSLVIIFVFTTCKKELSCEDCKDGNKPPIANAGRDTIIVLPKDSVMLDGSASTDPNGTITSYKWAKIAGPVSSGNINSNSAKTSVKSLVMGVYKFELTVTDNGGLSAKDTVQVLVADNSAANKPPIANAGPDQEIILPLTTVTLDGSGSIDPENDILTHGWTRISGPRDVTIVSTNAKQTQVTGLKPGTYQFELKVTDGGGFFKRYN